MFRDTSPPDFVFGDVVYLVSESPLFSPISPKVLMTVQEVSELPDGKTLGGSPWLISVVWLDLDGRVQQMEFPEELLRRYVPPAARSES